MKILIIGSGALGCFIGAILKQAGKEVVFLDLPEVINELSSKGITLEGFNQTIKIQTPLTVSSLRGYSAYEMIVVAVKSFNTASAVRHIPDYAAKKIISFQNGIGNEETLAEKFGKYRIIAGTVTYPVSNPSLGHVIIENPKGGFGISPMDSNSKLDLTSVQKMLQREDIEVLLHNDYRSLKWSKLMLNIICNAVCAILGMSPEEIYSDRKLVWIEKKSIQELLAVLKKKHISIIDLPGYPIELMRVAYSNLPPSMLKMVLKKRIQKSRGDKKPSLYLDLEKGNRQTEIDFYNGAIVKEANVLGINTPINSTLTGILKDITSGKVSWDDFKGQPEKLYQICRDNSGK